jgi:uncharacterized Ntn-hydrolase superfamily protein
MAYRIFSIITLAVLGFTSAQAQHTFSIVAVDPATGQVGSAGASCISVDAGLISDVHPGVGAIHTQSYWVAQNQDYGTELMDLGLDPDAIIDSLTSRDAQGRSDLRQYGAVVLAGGGKSAAYTGANCMDYKGHITGPTYAIQGNILLGKQILDSMEARFLREPGTLADKLMAALQGANVIGADTRCAPNSSSHSAFLRVARPGDPFDNLYAELHVTLGESPEEPIDSLQKLFDLWKGSTNSVRGERGSDALRMEIRPNPAASSAAVHYALAGPAPVSMALYDELGRQVRMRSLGTQGTGAHEVAIDRAGLPAGTYYCRLTAGTMVATQRVVFVSGGD